MWWDIGHSDGGVKALLYKTIFGRAADMSCWCVDKEMMFPASYLGLGRGILQSVRFTQKPILSHEHARFLFLKFSWANEIEIIYALSIPRQWKDLCGLKSSSLEAPTTGI